MSALYFHGIQSNPQESTGFSPNFLMFGRNSMPIDVMITLPSEDTGTQSEYAAKMKKRLAYAYELARTTGKQSVERQKRLYNERVFGTPIKQSDIVWVAVKTKKKGVSPKLQPRWKGPSLVLKMHNEVIAKYR